MGCLDPGRIVVVVEFLLSGQKLACLSVPCAAAYPDRFLVPAPCGGLLPAEYEGRGLERAVSCRQESDDPAQSGFLTACSVRRSDMGNMKSPTFWEQIEVCEASAAKCSRDENVMPGEKFLRPLSISDSQPLVLSLCVGGGAWQKT